MEEIENEISYIFSELKLIDILNKRLDIMEKIKPDILDYNASYQIINKDKEELIARLNLLEKIKIFISTLYN